MPGAGHRANGSDQHSVGGAPGDEAVVQAQRSAQRTPKYNEHNAEVQAGVDKAHPGLKDQVHPAGQHARQGLEPLAVHPARAQEHNCPGPRPLHLRGNDAKRGHGPRVKEGSGVLNWARCPGKEGVLREPDLLLRLLQGLREALPDLTAGSRAHRLYLPKQTWTRRSPPRNAERHHKEPHHLQAVREEGQTHSLADLNNQPRRKAAQYVGERRHGAVEGHLAGIQSAWNRQERARGRWKPSVAVG